MYINAVQGVDLAMGLLDGLEAVRERGIERSWRVEAERLRVKYNQAADAHNQLASRIRESNAQIVALQAQVAGLEKLARGLMLRQLAKK